jgi:hypothetical protein
MPTIKAKSLEIKLFVMQNGLYFDNGETYFDTSVLTDVERDGWRELDNALETLKSQLGSSFTSIATMRFFPVISDQQNAAWVNQNTPGGTNKLPVLSIEATYSDGSKARYIIYPGLISGAPWSEAALLPYFKVLLYQSKPGKQSIICTLVPSLCNLPSWVWLAAAVYATKETFDADGRPLAQLFYGATAFMAWETVGKKGGLKNVLK